MTLKTKMIFTRLLIANRGEIALRIMRTASRMNITTLAVFTREEAKELHVEKADYSHEITSYLSIESIIHAALEMKAEAIHPGYGFLAENAEFAQKCLDAGLIFVGPSPHAIKSMGDKAEAKALMKLAGVPIIEEVDGSKFPLMIKAVAGGGGRGMRLVEHEADFETHLKSAQNEALNAFGNATVILEKAIINPRHIEIQVMADRHGNVIHLGERDCSVQRRHQKLIEEAPSPAVTPEIREKMGAIAIQASKAINYEGAGTFEFLLDESGAFYFMEMNTRLQVEHPVTEAITGLDLVEMQLKIAMGEKLMSQNEVVFKGHAIEVRFCAEDPYENFLPQTGSLKFLAPQNIRIETALRAENTISSSFDSMIAKIIAHDETREGAISKLTTALIDTKAYGVKTNQRFLIEALNHETFRTGMATTAFYVTLEKPQANLKLAVSLFLEGYKCPFPYPLRIEYEGESYNCHTEPMAKYLGKIEFIIQNDDLYIFDHGYTHHYKDISLMPVIMGEKTNENTLKAVMNGKIVAISDEAITLEAMKMQHHHKVPQGKRIVKIFVKIGDQVALRQVLAELEP